MCPVLVSNFWPNCKKVQLVSSFIFEFKIDIDVGGVLIRITRVSVMNLPTCCRFSTPMDSSRRCNLSRQGSTFIDAQLAKLRMYRIHGLKMEQKNSKNGKWAKVLYQQSHLPDNYTDPNLFLEGLKRNLHFQPVGARTALLAATRVSTQIGVTIIFWAVFLQLKYSSPHWQVTYSAFTCFTLVAYMMVDGFRHFWEIIRSALYFLVKAIYKWILSIRKAN